MVIVVDDPADFGHVLDQQHFIIAAEVKADARLRS
jgi:hypothetical protein